MLRSRRFGPLFAALPLLLTCALLPWTAAAQPASGTSAEARPFDGPLLFEGATVGEEHVYFSTAGRLWRVPLVGGMAEPLTDGTAGWDTYPYLSPDGEWLAFSREGGDEEDVWVMPVGAAREPNGAGEAVRLTWHPKYDRPRGWTPDGSAVLFASGRDGDGLARLYTVDRAGEGPAGAFPTALPLPEAMHGSFSPDGRRLAYSPYTFGIESSHYRYYRGGQTTPLWVARLADSSVEVLEEPDANHHYPLWVGDSLFYTSDETGAFDLYRRPAPGIGTESGPDGRAEPLTRFFRYGIRYLAGGFGGTEAPRLVFVRDGRLYRVDTASGETAEIPVRIELPADRRAVRTVEIDSGDLDAFAPSPDGSLYAEARGEILRFALPGGEGRVLAPQSGGGLSAAADRDPAVSPDGRRLAYVSDRSGEYQIIVRELGEGGAENGGGEGEAGREKAFDVEDRPSFYEQLRWSPDGRRLAFSGQRLGLWMLDTETGEARTVDRSDDLAQERFNPSWSPDGRYLAYDMGDARHFRSVYLYDLESGERHRVSGQVHAEGPVFDRNGRYLHFTAAPLAPLGAANRIWGLLSAQLYEPHVTYQVYTALLRADEPPPYLPFGPERHPDAEPGEAVEDFRIDTDGLADRVVALPAPQAASLRLLAGAPGTLYLMSDRWPPAPGAGRRTTALSRFRIGEASRPDAEEIAADVDEAAVAWRAGEDGEPGWTAVLFTADGKLHRRIDEDGAAGRPEEEANGEDTGEKNGEATSEAPAVEEIVLRAEIRVDPAAEWEQMYHEAWRLMRDYFYDPGHHGQDLEALEERYADYLPGLARRQDLTYLLRTALGHVSISHMSIGGGDAATPEGFPEGERIGVLGADFRVDRGRYRIETIYRRGPASSWSRLAAAAPLDSPGVEVREGEYLLAVGDRPVDASRNLYSYFTGTAYRPTEITVGPDPDAAPGDAGTRRVMVVPVGGDNTIRRSHWFEENRRRVDELSGGRIGYVAAMNYGPGAISEFISQLGAQADKEGWVIDQRFGPGGITSDTLVDLLAARPLHRYAFPYGEDLTVPTLLPRGPKVVLINHYDGSASETFPLMVKLAGVGTLVGTRTLGGGTGGAMSYPRLADGGRVTVPNRASYDPVDGTWAENRGVEPDVEVPWWPAEWRAGEDPQLERAVALALEQAGTLEQAEDGSAPAEAGRPPYPVHPEGVEGGGDDGG